MSSFPCKRLVVIRTTGSGKSMLAKRITGQLNPDHIELDAPLGVGPGDIPKEEIAAVIPLAHRMCFTESALMGTTRITTRHVFNGEEIEVLKYRNGDQSWNIEISVRQA